MLAKVKRSNRDRDTLESQHSYDLIRIYKIYSLLRDFYKHYKSKKIPDNEIGKLISQHITGTFHKNNRNFLTNALTNIKNIHTILLTEDINSIHNKKIIIGAAKENMEYIKKMIQIVDDIVYHQNIKSLKEQITLFND